MPPNSPPSKSRNSLELSYCWLKVFTENLKSIPPCIAASVSKHAQATHVQPIPQSPIHPSQPL